MHVFGTSKVQEPLSLSLRELLLKDIQGTLLNDEDEYVLSEEGFNFLVHILNHEKTKGLNKAIVVSQAQLVRTVNSLLDHQYAIPSQIQILPYFGSRGKPRQRLDIHYPAIHLVFQPQKKPIGFLADHYYGAKSPVMPQITELVGIDWVVLTTSDDMAPFQTDHTHCYVIAIEFLRYMNKLSIDEITTIWAAGKSDNSGLKKLRWQDLPVKFMRDYQSVGSISKFKVDPTSSWQKTPVDVQKKFEERALRWTSQVQTAKGLKRANVRIAKRASARMAIQMTSALTHPDRVVKEELISICYSTKPQVQALLLSVAKGLGNERHPLFSYCFDNLPFITRCLEDSVTLRTFLMSEDEQLRELQKRIPTEILFKMTDRQVMQLISQKDRYCDLLRLPAFLQININIMSLMSQTNSKEALLRNLKENLELLSPLDLKTLLEAEKLNDSILNLLSKKKFTSATMLLEACIYKAPDITAIDMNADIARYANASKGSRPRNLAVLSHLVKQNPRSVSPLATQACDVEAQQSALESSSSDEDCGYEETLSF